MWNIIRLDLDIKKKNHNYIEINQADDMCLNVKFYNNGQPLDLVDGEDKLIINYANANGTVTGDSSIDRTMSKSGAMIYFPRNCTNSAGTAHMQITINTNKLYTANKQITSFPIDIKIHQSVVDGKAVSTNVNSMIDDINKATIEGNKIINNIKDTATKYPESSQLYADVEDLKIREYGAENLIRDAGFNGSIGDGFCWKTVNSSTNTSVVYAPSLKSGNYITVNNTSDTEQPGIMQIIEAGNTTKKAYTVEFLVYSTKGNNIFVQLDGVGYKKYSVKEENKWERVKFTFNENTYNWATRVLRIFANAKSNFLVADIAMWEGENSFSFKFNSKDCIYDRIIISGKDVLSITKSGKYAGVGCINNPFGDTSSWAYYDIDVHSSTYKKIVAKSYHSSLVYENTMNNGTWSGWVNKNNLSSLNQDSTHRLVSDAEKNKWNMVTGSGALQQQSYCKLPNGIIIQWGVTNVSIPSKSSATSTATFPTPFPNKLLTIQTNVNRNISTMDKTGCENIIVNGIMANGVDADKAGVPIFAKDVIGSGSNWTFEVGWIAIGY